MGEGIIKKFFLTPPFRAHASAAPWEGKNALDAAFAAYSNVSLLRQQIHPSHRVHGIVKGKDWAPNSSVHSLSHTI